MSAAIFDFETIAKHARLKALDGTPQNVVQPMGVETAPVEFDGYGMYAGWPYAGEGDSSAGRLVSGSGLEVVSSHTVVTIAQADLPNWPVGFVAMFPDYDGAVAGAGIYPAVPHVWTGQKWERQWVDTAPSEWSAPEQDPA